MSPCGCGRHRREERSPMCFTAADTSIDGLCAKTCGQSIIGSTLQTSCMRRRIKRDLKPGGEGTPQTRATRFWADAAISPTVTRRIRSVRQQRRSDMTGYLGDDSVHNWCVPPADSALRTVLRETSLHASDCSSSLRCRRRPRAQSLTKRLP